jgi:hypothetical protein
MDSFRSDLEPEEDAKNDTRLLSEEQDLRRWVKSRNMVPIGDGCYITKPPINQE